MEADVPMVEHGCCVEKDLKEKDGKGRRTQGGHRGRLDPHREKDLDRMKPSSRREIEIEVRMMHHVEPPEAGHGVKHYMLKVDHTIEEDHPKDHLYPEGKRVYIQ